MEISGVKVLFSIPIFGGIQISETVVAGWVVLGILIALVAFFSSRVERIPKGKQALAEEFVSFIYGQVESTAGKKFAGLSPYIGTIFLMSMVSSLAGLIGLRPPTTDLNTTLAWAIVTFVLVSLTKIKSHGLFGHLKEYANPLNIIESLMLPVSMALRHFCNILSGYIVMELIGTFLHFLSSSLLGKLGESFPVFKVAIPAVLSAYFDLFGSLIQAFVFIMLSMVFIGRAAGEE
ncbi:MAG: F0F1 ATP synthase subunit A [Oscillospiraceae bacterium]|nr:F0F1 ATP synthase subunit A [Oscillospiraceae bacterium]